MIVKGCTTFILALGIVGVLFFAGCTSVMRSFADWRMSANGVTVAVQQTEQVRLQEDGATERSRIEWNARMAIAETQADATKKTSGMFVMFYLVRGLMWGAGILLTIGVAGLGAVIYKGAKQ